MSSDAPADAKSDAAAEAVPSQDELDDLRFVLEQTRVILLQQILTHDTGTLSAAELQYWNPDLEDTAIQYHLREMEDRGVVTKLRIPAGERQRDLPSTFYAVTETGIDLLERANLLGEMLAWQEMCDRMERTDEIARIEAMDRPEPDWY
jgi:DNA-binding HxlR family transcriptional regulator